MSKPAVQGRGGVVATQHYLASAIGARVLREGGNAVDAAVAAGLAISVVEPWMSGLGGCGCMLVYTARDQKVHAVDFGVMSPAALDPADYPLAGGQGGDLFGWPAVVEDRNLIGYPSISVPGYVAGIAHALETFGTRSWEASVAPAIELAERGVEVDWHTTLMIASNAAALARDPASRAWFLPGGHPPAGDFGAAPPRLPVGRLRETLLRLAKMGPRDIYEGETAAHVIRDLNAGGNPMTRRDLASYAPLVGTATAQAYRGATVHTTGGLNAGPTLNRVLNLLDRTMAPGGMPTTATYRAYAEALLRAYEERLRLLGHAGDQRHPSSTTHISVVDAEGNIVSLTQTLLSIFGSKVTLPETGLLMNNGIMWFDPRPGGPNALKGGARGLSNMCPVIVERADGFRFAAGASGGRRIMPAVMQLLSFAVDFRMDLDTAFRQPRIDVSGTPVVTLDNRLPPATIAELAAAFEVQVVQDGVYPKMFACPNAAGRHPTGMAEGAAFIASPWAEAVAV